MQKVAVKARSRLRLYLPRTACAAAQHAPHADFIAPENHLSDSVRLTPPFHKTASVDSIIRSGKITLLPAHHCDSAYSSLLPACSLFQSRFPRHCVHGSLLQSCFPRYSLYTPQRTTASLLSPLFQTFRPFQTTVRSTNTFSLLCLHSHTTEQHGAPRSGALCCAGP
jgi:hypothetical protein